MLNKKALFTHPFIFPDLPIDHLFTIIYKSSALDFAKDEQLQKELDVTFHHHVSFAREHDG